MISQFKKADEAAREFVEEPLSKAATLLDSLPYKRTVLATLSLTGRIDFISQGIFILLGEEHIYPAKIVFRSLIEHFLKSQYIWTRWAIEKSDSVGEDYMRFCNLNEELDLATAYKRQGKIMGTTSTHSPFDVIKSLHPELALSSDSEIKEKAAQFSHKRIIEYISSHVYETGFKSEEAFLPNILHHYADLSSFVHGGPMAVKQMVGLDNETKLAKQIENIAELTVSVSSASKEFALILLSNVDKQFIESTRQFRELLTSLRSTSSNALAG